MKEGKIEVKGCTVCLDGSAKEEEMPTFFIEVFYDGLFSIDFRVGCRQSIGSLI
jgi:hypothetical protein